MHTKQKFEIGSVVSFTELDTNGEYNVNDMRQATVVMQSKEFVIVTQNEGRDEIALNIHDYEIQDYVSPEEKLIKAVEWALRESSYANSLPGSVCKGLSRDIAFNLISGYGIKL